MFIPSFFLVSVLSIFHTWFILKIKPKLLNTRQILITLSIWPAIILLSQIYPDPDFFSILSGNVIAIIFVRCFADFRILFIHKITQKAYLDFLETNLKLSQLYQSFNFISFFFLFLTYFIFTKNLFILGSCNGTLVCAIVYYFRSLKQNHST